MYSDKIHRDLSRTIATSKTELFVALVSSFQLLTNFTKNFVLCVTGALDLPLEYYLTCSESCAGAQIKQSFKTAACNLTKNEQADQI